MAIHSYIDEKTRKTRYWLKAYVGLDPLTGKEIRVNRKGYPSRKAAELELARLRLGISQVSTKRPKLGAVIEEWKAVYINTVKPSTYHSTESLLRVHIEPVMGDFFIDKIKVIHVQDWINKNAPNLVKYKEVIRYLSRIFDFAMSRNYCNLNPCKDVSFPKMIEKKKKKVDIIWTKEELKYFLEIVRDNYPMKWYAFFRLLAYTGMRRGEILALNWNDLDIKGKTLSISKSLKRTTKGEVIGDTKTGESRTITLDTQTIRALIFWRQLQLRAQGRQEIMFTNTKGDYMLLNHPLKTLNSIIKKYNLKPIDIHRFRHIHTTMLILSNPEENSIGAVKDRLGHADIKTTLNIYNHVLEEQKIELLDNYLDYVEEKSSV